MINKIPFQKGFLFLSILCIIISYNHVVLGNVLGEVEVVDTFSVKSVEVETKFDFQTDDSLTKPKLVFTLTKGSAEFSDLIHQQPGTNQFIIGAGDEISNGNKLSFSLITLFSSILISLFVTKNRMIVVFAILLGCSSFVFALNVAELGVTVTVKVPSGYLFKSVSLETASGSLDINGLQSSILSINACHGKSFPIKFNGLSISTLTVCSQSSVDLTSFQVTPGSVTNITTTDKINVSFMMGYTGKLSIQSNFGIKESINGSCTWKSQVNGTSKYLSVYECGGDSTSDLNLYGDLGVTVYSVLSCPIVSTWRDPAPAFDGPTSPSISTTTKQIVFPLNNRTDFIMYAGWMGAITSFKQMGAGTTFNGISVAGALAVGNKDYGTDNFQLVSNKNDFYFRPEVKYRLELDLLFTENNLGKELSLCVFDRFEPNGDTTWIPPYLPTECTKFTQTGSALGSKTAWTSLSLDYTPSKTFGKSVIGIKFNVTQVAPATTVYVRNTKLTVLSKTVTTPTLLNKDSELVNLRKPTTTPTPQDRSTCPHLQTGLSHWHDPATWGGAVPSPSSVITLPNNTKVLISSCSIDQTSVYQKIIVPASSQLIFSDSSYTMHVHDIDVRGQLLMGSAKCRMNGDINIIFHGQKTSADTIAPFLGSKGIAVSRGGYISVQGKQYFKTWSRLAATVYPYETIIYLQDDVNWEVGQRVFITTSVYEDEYDQQNEVKTIAAINGRVVEFVEPFKFVHYGGQEYQAEVGLLSRRIKFTGADDSDAGQFGGHVLSMSNGQFAGIQLTKMGQTNMKGRYPLHFHLAGTVQNSYISDCSVQQSYYRCYTIHGTNELTVEQNTAFDAIGHCYYIEDGVEENNTVAYNLGAFVHTIGRPAAGNGQGGETFYQNATLTQPADVAAGIYYITNAYNRIIGNAASGGWASFSFPNLPRPIGNFRNRTDINPSSRTTLEFDGNSAHSAGYFFWFGSCIYCGGKLYFEDINVDKLTYISGRVSRDTVDINGNPVWMRWTNLKVSQCSAGAGHWGNQIEIDGFESHDNKISATLFGSAWMNNGIVNGFSNNPVDPRIWYNDVMYTRQGFQFYDTVTQTILSNINFRNFAHDVNAETPESDNKVIVSMTHSDVYKPQQMSATTNLSFKNVPDSQRIGHYIRETGSSRYFNFIDWDGSVSLRPGAPRIIGSSLDWWNYDNTCQFRSDWGSWVCDKGTREIGNIVMSAPNFIWNDDSQGDNIINVGNSSLFGPNLPSGPHTAYITNNAGITGIINLGWYLNFFNGVSPPSFQIETRQITYGNWLLVAITYPAGTTFTGTYGYPWGAGYKPLVKGTSQSDVLNGDGTKYYFDGTNLFLKLVDKGMTANEYFTRGGIKIMDLDWGYSYNINAACPNNNCVRTDTSAKPPTWVN